MAKAYILGAGASHSYRESKTGIQPPLASNMFKTYCALPVAADFRAPVGQVVNYVRDTRGIPPVLFVEFEENAEDFLTEIDERLNQAATTWAETPLDKKTGEMLAEFGSLNGAYDQCVWLFARAINETQNGPVSSTYRRLVASASEEDEFITFNWDTLLDRALYESSKWNADSGYCINFRLILESQWREPQSRQSQRRLLKLHGSTNWLVNYMTRDLRTGQRGILRAHNKGDKQLVAATVEPYWDPEEEFTIRYKADVRTVPAMRLEAIPAPGTPDSLPFCFLFSDNPYPCFRSRYKAGYDVFSYFYPPDSPLEQGIPLMPLIIPPTRRKLYEEFGHIFVRLWETAEDALVRCDEWTLIGYSLPITDARAIELFTRALGRKAGLVLIRIVNPRAADVEARMREFLPADRVEFAPPVDTFEEYLDLAEIRSG